MKCTSCVTIGTRIHCEVQGDGPLPLVFLHGFAAASPTWDDLRGYFPLERYRLHLLDLKGAGRSAAPRDGAYRPEDQAALVIDLLDGLNLRNVVLVGHSLGGGIALMTLMAARAAGKSSLIDRLVLIDAAAYPQEPPYFFRYLRRPLLGHLLLRLLPVRATVRYNLEFIYHDPAMVTEERIKRYVGCFSGSDSIYALIATVRHLDPVKYSSRLPAYGSITLPTLIIWGRHDRVVPLELGERLHAEIPGSRMRILECGHNPHEEKAKECAVTIREFLESAND